MSAKSSGYNHICPVRELPDTTVCVPSQNIPTAMNRWEVILYNLLRAWLKRPVTISMSGARAGKYFRIKRAAIEQCNLRYTVLRYPLSPEVP